LSIWSRAAAIYDELEDLDLDSRHRHGLILSRLAWDRFDGATAGATAALSAEPPDIARVSELLAEPLRLFHRSCEVLMTVLDELPDSAGLWASNQTAMAFCHDTSGRLEDALECYDRMIELHDQGRAGLNPVELTRAWRSRAQCLGKFGRGRRVEALTSWHKAEEHAGESGDPDLLGAVRAEMAEVARGLAEGTA
jgi:tetratricopeptide (TPR) repeat protein